MMKNNDSAKLYTALHRLGRQLHRCSHHVVHKNGFYREQSRLLLLIAENDGIIQHELAEEMDVRASSMTQMLGKMEQLGLIYREQDDKDQRVMHIFLTEEGKTAAELSQSAEDKLTVALFQGLTGEEIEEMLLLTEKLTTYLDNMDATALAQEVSLRRERHNHRHRDFD